MSLVLAQVGASVFSSVPDAGPTLSLEHHSHPEQQISHTDEGGGFPGAELHSWDPEVFYKAGADTQSPGFFCSVLWLLRHQQSPPAKWFSGQLCLHEETLWPLESRGGRCASHLTLSAASSSRPRCRPGNRLWRSGPLAPPALSGSVRSPLQFQPSQGLNLSTDVPVSL